MQNKAQIQRFKFLWSQSPRLFSAYHSGVSGFLLLVFVILTGPNASRQLPRPLRWGGAGFHVGVLAAPCATGDNGTSVAGGTQDVYIKPDTAVDELTIFNCSDGDFKVFWSGVVNVPQTIYIGRGTTVKIVGITTNSSPDGGDDSIKSYNRNDEQVEELLSGLTLPEGLTAAVVGPRTFSAPAANADISFGPIFFVDGGQLFLENVLIRNGFAMNSTNNLISSGGGVHAIESNITVIGCEFSNNFAEYWGGGIFATQSTLTVENSVFSGCQAGFPSFAGEEGIEGAGGGIMCLDSNVSINGCFFESCYASKKGAGMQHSAGQMSVVDSLFYSNTAGSDNIEDEEEIGEGGAISLDGCTRSFDGLAACGVNYTSFVNNHVARKGGAVAIAGETYFSDVEFHGCMMENSTTGIDLKVDPQGEGGVFFVDKNTSLLLADCLITDSYSGKKGGVMFLSSGDNNFNGATAIIKSSTFTGNTAGYENGGVMSLGLYSKVTIAGDGNVFADNLCDGNGGVLSALSDTKVIIEGGKYSKNLGKRDGGVFETSGELEILRGGFFNNEADKGGVVFASGGSSVTLKDGTSETNEAERSGVVFASDENSITSEGGIFEANEAIMGAAVYVDTGAKVYVEGGNFALNSAKVGGGVLYVGDDGSTEITGGNFTENHAELGGFLYKEGRGNTSCKGTSVRRHTGVDGGAIYITNATLDWQCDLRENKALAGPAIYAQGGATVNIRGVSLHDNNGARGSVIFLDSSFLATCEVEFNDTSKTVDLSAVQADAKSTYMAEGTSFVGFAGESVIFSDGIIFLDGCDFSKSSATVLVHSRDETTTVIRNTIIGNQNYLSLADAASQSRTVPSASSLTNVKITCDSIWDNTKIDEGFSICSNGSVCLNGDFGVYCQCYVRRFTSKEVCANGDSSALALYPQPNPGNTFYPDLLEEDIVLSFEATAAINASATTYSSTAFESAESGLVWHISASSSEMIEWTVFPLVGLLLPGQRINVRIVGIPGGSFDGTVTVKFTAQITAEDDIGTEITASSNFSFYHCRAESIRNDSFSSDVRDLEKSCVFCADFAKGDVEGLDCSKPGSSKRNLVIKPGYWRASLDSDTIHHCFNKDACGGGSSVESVQDYCKDGYEGPYCAICSSGYGQDVANGCHICSDTFKRGMFFLLAVVSLLSIITASLLAVYLVRGMGAVSSKISTTKRCVTLLKDRYSIYKGKYAGGRLGFGTTTLSIDSRTCGQAHGLPTGSEITRGGLEVDSIGYSGQPSVGIEASVPSQSIKTGMGKRMSGQKEAHRGADRNSYISKSATTATTIAGSNTLYATLNDPNPAAQSSPKPGITPASIVAQPNSAGNNVCTDDAGESKTYSSSADGMLEGDDYMRHACHVSKSLTPSLQVLRHQSSGGRTEDGGSDGSTEEESQKDKKTAAITIGGILSDFPMSKLKIVIVVWQISSAFGEITQVPFPTIYGKFLSVIRLFSFDLSWMFSAACLASGIGFYDKLLIVTIGPLVLLSLMGVTFFLGLRLTRRPLEKEWTTSNYRIKPTTKIIFSSQEAEHTPRTSMSRNIPSTWRESPVSDVEVSLREGEGRGVRSASARAKSKTVKTDKRRAERYSGCEEMAPGQRGPTRIVPRRSLRNLLQEGPEDGSDPEQDFAQNQLWALFSRHTTLLLIILYLVYTQISTVVFQTFECQKLPEIGKSYLRADFRVECGTATHDCYELYAAVMIILYPVGIPLAFWHSLVRQKENINPPLNDSLKELRGELQVELEKIKRRSTDLTVAPTSFLWNAYFPSCYYFEVCECFRRLLLTGVLVFLVPDTPGQVAFGCIFSFVSLLWFELLRPHIDELDKQLYRTGCLVIFFNNFLALMIKAEVADPESRGSMIYAFVLIVVNVLFFISIWWDMWLSIKASLCAGSFQNLIFGVDIVTERQVGKFFRPAAKKTARAQRVHGKPKNEDRELRPV